MTHEQIIGVIGYSILTGVILTGVLYIGAWTHTILSETSAWTFINGFILQVGNDPAKIRELCDLHDPKGRLAKYYEHMSKHVRTVNRQHRS